MNVLVIIPARGGSKRLPRKNIKLLGNDPLVVWTIKLARRIKVPGVNVVDVMVSTDDAAIARVAEDAGAYVPWLRPVELACDETPGIDVCLHALSWYETKKNLVDAVLLLQPTTPFRRMRDMEEGMQTFLRNPESSVIGVTNIAKQVNFMMHLNDGKLSSLATKTQRDTDYQSHNIPVCVNGSFYLAGTKFLKKEKTFFYGSPMPLLADSIFSSVDIDTHDDWELAALLAPLFNPELA